MQNQVFKGKIGLEEQRWEDIRHCLSGQLIVGYFVLFRLAIPDRTAARNQMVLVDELLYGSPDRLSADMRQGILCCGCSQDTTRKRSEDQNLLRSQIVGNHGEKPPEIIRSL